MASLRSNLVPSLNFLLPRPMNNNFKTRSRILCVGWDPEGLLGPPQTGHITRLEFKRTLEKDAGAREAFERQVREEQQQRRTARQGRVVPDTVEGLVEYFLDTEARELEFEIARLRPRLNEEFFKHLQFELGQLRFAVTKTKDMEDRLIELEAMQKVLLEGTEAYDRMQADLILAKERLARIFQSKDKKATLLEMVEKNEINRSLLTILDENIATAYKDDQKQAAEFMEKIRAAILKYMTV
ncbi:uncharacterized protein LOC18429264 isoform X1 [Amborella trichopoda]|uniref:Uncharacterized protein n=1 Tax=Amborella trichopoda TaxID=13333 RepID=W1NZU8_AMBTC|nr:uncharacterized protein LOC18429264 isoform X1 [Amborella trichopoda]ERN01183.1 hypothetical protein AMTR_s00002p00229060 [Amborella trichopoda]|eukprot:XP_006838614.1 uncharacterized protein LOC18429264 isoform X1 [Amborella trichopoda]